ncbi:hypothetical protein GEMRC1_010385 [Eukaryota sp. GEM-RC1]
MTTIVILFQSRHLKSKESIDFFGEEIVEICISRPFSMGVELSSEDETPSTAHSNPSNVQPVPSNVSEFLSKLNHYCSEINCTSLSDLLSAASGFSISPIHSIQRLISKYQLPLFSHLRSGLAQLKTSEASLQCVKQYIDHIEVYYLMMCNLKVKHSKLCSRHFKLLRHRGSFLSSLSWTLFVCTRKFLSGYRIDDFQTCFALLLGCFHLSTSSFPESPSLDVLCSSFPFISTEDVTLTINRVSTWVSSSLGLSLSLDPKEFHKILLTLYDGSKSTLMFDELSLYPHGINPDLSPSSQPQTSTYHKPLHPGGDGWIKVLYGENKVAHSRQLVDLLDKSNDITSAAQSQLDSLLQIVLSGIKGLEPSSSLLSALYIYFLSNILLFEEVRLGQRSSFKVLVVSPPFTSSLIFLSSLVLLQTHRAITLEEEVRLLSLLSLSAIEVLPVIEALIRSNLGFLPVREESFLKELELRFITFTGFLSQSSLYRSPSGSAFRPNPMIEDGRVGFFLRKVIGFGHLKIKNLAFALGVENDVLVNLVCSCFKAIANRQLNLFENRHVDTIILCTFYDVCNRSFKCKSQNSSDQRSNIELLASVALEKELSFASIIEVYRIMPYSYSNSVDQVYLSENQYTDINSFYNSVYVEATADLIGHIQAAESPSPRTFMHNCQTPFQGNPLPAFFPSGTLRRDQKGGVSVEKSIRSSRVLFKAD